METKLTHILDSLTAEEASILLDSKLNFPMDKRAQIRIINSTKKKCGLKYHASSNKLKIFYNVLLLKRRLLFSLVSLIITIGLGSILYLYSQTPTTYVCLDINPSVELGVNRFNKVVNWNAYNIDGEKLIHNTPLKNLKIDSAINNLVSSAIKQDYLSNDTSFVISLATTVDDKSTESKLNEDLKDAIYITLNNSNIHINPNIGIITSTSDISKRNVAKDIGMSFGKLNLIEELIDLSPSIKIEDYKDKPIESIQQKINELKNDKVASISKNEILDIIHSNVSNTSSLPDSNSSTNNSMTNSSIVNNSNTSMSNNTTSKPDTSNNLSNNSGSSTSTAPPTSSGGNNNNSSNEDNNKPNNSNRPEHSTRPNNANKPSHWNGHNKYNNDDKHNNKHHYKNKNNKQNKYI